MTTAKGLVFNIQKYSVHDGPGIRTLVFLKGCPLRCFWCCNPESQSPRPELGYNPARCFGCGRCVAACGRGALGLLPPGASGGPLVLNRERCGAATSACAPDAPAGGEGGAPPCADVCPDKALAVYGKRMSVAGVLEIVEQDGQFYARSGGGLGISGGEAFMQPDFLLALLAEAARRRLNTALETCAYAPAELFLSALPYVSYLMIDVKHMDPARHQEGTGKSNERILGNIRAARRRFPDLPLKIRTPVIPGFNDSAAAVAAIARFAAEQGAAHELLAYHRMGASKYASLGRDYAPGDARLEPAAFAALQKTAADVAAGA